MLFTELRFVVFLVLVLGVHALLRRGAARKAWLLVASYAFYAAWDWRFLSLIVVSTLVDYVAGLRVAESDHAPTRRAWLASSLVVNLGLLGFFKYYGFFVDSFVELAAFVGLDLPPRTLAVVLPVGISFYTFQTLSYTIDVYRGRLEPTRRLLDLALFVAFFPQLVAGPIVRASQFLPQLARRSSSAPIPWRTLLTMFLIGYVKKACLADNAAIAVDAVYAQPDAFGAASVWLASALYAIQIYGDFSGYSDMAIATAGMLGYTLPENFRFPYVAASVTDFWRRWHISLSTWFRDYLYIPLGGNRGPSARTSFNLLVVFVLCGLWHGAALHFVVWGLYHGAFLMGERIVGGGRLREGRGALRVAFTVLVVTVGWVLFRAPDLSTAGVVLARMAGAGPVGPERLHPAWWALVAAFAVAHAVGARAPLERRAEALPSWAYAIAYGAAVALVLPWAASDHQPFIYFQF